MASTPPRREGTATRNQAKQLLLSFDGGPLELMSPDEIYAKANAELLGSLQEDRRIERKPAKFGGDSLGEYLSMWANTPPDGGLIVLGQADNGAFSGCNVLTTSEINQREKSGHTHCPDARLEVKRVAVTNLDGEQDYVLLFRVQYNSDSVVRTTNGKAFVRKGDSKIELKPDEVRELQADKGEISFEQQSTSIPWPDGFNQAAISNFVQTVCQKRDLSPNLSTEEVLTLRRLGTIYSGAFQPNIACALLFAMEPLRLIPGCKIRFQRFEGETEGTGERYNAVKDIILEGTVPELIRQVETELESQLRTFSPLDAKLKFYPQPEYPKPAWYEAVVNACVHRSYGNGMKNMPIFVKMFDDRLVIQSPGPFPPFVTPTNIYESHHPRNPHLMDAMFYLEYVKCAHEGTRRIRDTMQSVRLPAPEFSQNHTGPAVVSVTLRNNVRQRRAWVDKDVTKIVSEVIVKELSEDEIRAVNLAAENGKVTISDANKVLGVTWDRARRLLLELARKRIFQYVRFKPFEKDMRDPKAFFRLRGTAPLPDGAYEQVVVSIDD